MTLLLWDDLRAWALRTLPVQVFFLFLFGFPDALLISNPFPALYHGVLYYWTIHRPESLSFPLLLAGSFFFDALVGYRLGHTFIEILCVFIGVLYQRKNLTNAPFIVVWACFVFCMAFFVSGAALMRLFQSKPFLCLDLFYSFLWTAASYPLLNWGLERVNRFLGPAYV